MRSIAADLQVLADRLARARAAQGGKADGDLVQELETAYEELRVADEEVRVQEEEIAGLLRHQDAERVAHARLLAVLPVAVLLTDQRGIVRTANAEAAVLVGRRPDRIEGRPVFTFFGPDDRPAMRELPGRAASQVTGGPRTGVLVTGTQETVPVEVTVTVADREQGLFTWLLLTAGAGRPDGVLSLPDGLARLAELPVEDASPEDVVRASLEVCRDVLGPDVELTVLLGSPEEPEAVVSTGQLAQVLDGSQLQAGEGPTSSAYRERATVWATDVRADPRWPRWASAVSERGLAVVAVPLQVSGQVGGVLTGYRVGGPADSSLAENVETLALTVRGLLQQVVLRAEIRQAAADLDRALSSRAMIDQAKGIVMAREGCSAEDAFRHLVDVASTEHVKLRDLAATIVTSVSDGVHRDPSS
ncbi:ANTAR domain-containing protein [Nocardioides dongkuii]|uniref:ANTAR domain-containing protein n=1 Tax=Nocardioides dongkuii TaxID=2760089 RepID=UPI0015FA7A9E|nr:ANTAR domain-containing protein [Nocardioides dongkuii]